MDKPPPTGRGLRDECECFLGPSATTKNDSEPPNDMLPVTENPYEPPNARCVAEPQPGIFRELKWGSTWLLLGLGIITVGTYHAHYCARQSRIINRYSISDPIPPAFTIAIFIVSYASLALSIGYFLVDESHPIATASNLFDIAWTIMIMVWGFYARNRVNNLAAFTEDNPRRISGLWTFLFSPLHLNYKINKFNQDPGGPPEIPHAPTPAPIPPPPMPY